MKFNQVFLKMSYNGAIKVYRIIKTEEISDGSIANTMKHIGTFSRYDKVPENIWNARICEIKAEAADMVVILSILVYTLFSRMFDLMQPPAVKHSIAVV